MKQLISFLTVILLALNAQGQCNPTFVATASPTQTNFLTYTFQNTSGPTTTPQHGVIYTWNFGDNTPTVGSYYNDPVGHGYSATGTYQVKLKMYRIDTVGTTITSCIDSITQALVVSQPPCASSFTYVINPANNGQVTFTATNPANTPGIVYTWHFGDATTGTGQTITHTYANSTGAITVTLTASVAAQNCSYNYQLTIPMVVNGCTNHVADFNYGSTGTTASFSSNWQTWGANIAVSWDFGDGNTGTGWGAGHTYANLGTYTVTMVCSWVDSANNNTLLCSTTYSHQITLTAVPPPPSGISIHYTDWAPPLLVQKIYKIWLITYDPNTSMLAAVDSLVDTAAIYWGGTVLFTPPPGTYLAKVARINGPTSGTGAIPTYADSSAFWSGANSIVYPGGVIVSSNIGMMAGTITSGPGFIAGNVNQGANKGTGGAPVPDMEIILMNASGVAMQHTHTDANGDYSFSDLPLGTYSIYPEELNFVATPYTGVQLTSASPSKSGFVFGVINGNEIRPKNTAVTEIPGDEGLNIRPNPSNGKFFISWTKAVSDYAITVTDLTGNLVYKGQGKSGSTAQELNLQSLQTGMYFIKLENANLNVTQKLIIQR